MSVAAAQGQPATDVATPSSDHTVAVLPFSNLSGAETDQWIGRGIAETLAANLGQAPGLTVLPPEALGQGLNVDERAVLRARPRAWRDKACRRRLPTRRRSAGK